MSTRYSCSVVASSKTKKSPPSVEYLSVPLRAIEPSITETNPVAVEVLESETAKVRTSPTSYFVPASSTTTPLTSPISMLPILDVASPLPIFSSVSISIDSETPYNAPDSSTVTDDTIELTVNYINVSVTFETTCIVSPLTNEAFGDKESRLSSNSIIETEDSFNDKDETTTADAPEVSPVIVLPIA